MTDLTPSFPSDFDVLTVFREELASAATRPDALGIDPALWPRFAGYYQGLTRLPRRLRRALQRRWRRSLGGLALLLALGQAPVLAGTINVDGVNCTLIDAITAANNNGFAGGCAAGSGADTIVLPPNSTHTLTAVNNTTFGSNGLPVITSPITIDGNGSTIRREPTAPDFRILAVAGGDLTLQETTVSGGRATGSSFDPQRGGGLLNRGMLSLVGRQSLGISRWLRVVGCGTVPSSRCASSTAPFPGIRPATVAACPTARALSPSPTAPSRATQRVQRAAASTPAAVP